MPAHKHCDSAAAELAKSTLESSERQACVSVPVLPLQLLWRRRPQWRGTPVAVIPDESADAPLLLLSQQAQKRGLRTGLRQGAARNLVPDLRTGVVSDEELQAWSDELLAALRTFSPRVERDDRFVGCFFVDPNGLGKLYGGFDTWAKTVAQYFHGRRITASVVVGFRRYRSYAIAREVGSKLGGRLGAMVLDSEKQERQRSNNITLRSLGFPESLCDPLAMLDVHTLGSFLNLPAGELRTRFGKSAAELHELFSDSRQLPMQPETFEAPHRVSVEVSPPAKDRERLLFYIKSGLDKLTTDIHQRGRRLTSLTISFRMEPWANRGPKLEGPQRIHEETLEPASPLDDSNTFLELIRLRLSQTELAAAAEELTLEAETVAMHGQQLRTEIERPKRDRDAAARALARVRASFGKSAVSRARIRSAHLPEAQFRLEPLAKLPDRAPTVGTAAVQGAAVQDSSDEASQSDPVQGGAVLNTSAVQGSAVQDSSIRTDTVRPTAEAKSHEALLRIRQERQQRQKRQRHKKSQPRKGKRAEQSTQTSLAFPQRPPLQRRLLRRPKPIGTTADGGPRLKTPVVSLTGPHRLSGGWWGAKKATQRDYYFAETESGAIYWVYWDAPKSRWFLHGHVD